MHLFPSRGARAALVFSAVGDHAAAGPAGTLTATCLPRRRRRPEVTRVA
jgi:hypothetical protein